MTELTMEKVTLPETSEETDESLVVLWYKSEGDDVAEGEALVEIQTEKTTFEVESTASGTLKEICVQRGERATVGDVLAVISRENGGAKHKPGPAEDSKTSGSEQSGSFVPAPPRIRRLAKQLGVDLRKVKGTGANGRLTENDIREAAEANSTTITEAGQVRRTIAKRMMESLHGSAQLTETAWADVTALAEKKQEWQENASWTDWVLRSVILTLSEYPMLNATWRHGNIEMHHHVNLGIAADTEKGLLVPVIKKAEQLTFAELHDAAKRKVEMAKTGRAKAEDLSGGTFTVTSLGAYGIQFFTPIINPPEAAILGVGQIEPYVVLENGQPQERFRLPLSLTFDHRIVDGAPAARFLRSLISRLEQPREMIEESGGGQR